MSHRVLPSALEECRGFFAPSRDVSFGRRLRCGTGPSRRHPPPAAIGGLSRTSTRAGRGLMERSTSPDPVAVLDEARARIRAPWAASVAGLLFAVFFTVGLILI